MYPEFSIEFKKFLKEHGLKEDNYARNIIYWLMTEKDADLDDLKCGFYYDMDLKDGEFVSTIIRREISNRLLIHHINPITIEDIELRRDCVFDPDNLICTANNTHQAIHYGDATLLAILPQERRRGDTCLWKRY